MKITATVNIAYSALSLDVHFCCWLQTVLMGTFQDVLKLHMRSSIQWSPLPYGEGVYTNSIVVVSYFLCERFYYRQC